MSINWQTTYAEISALASGLALIERSVAQKLMDSLSHYGTALDSVYTSSIDDAETQARTDFETALSTWQTNGQIVFDQAEKMIHYVQLELSVLVTFLSFVAEPETDAKSRGTQLVSALESMAGTAERLERSDFRDILRSYASYVSSFYATYPVYQTPQIVAEAPAVTVPPEGEFVTEQFAIPQLREKLQLLVDEGNAFVLELNWTPML